MAQQTAKASGTQFYIVLGNIQKLVEENNVVFGQVVKGINTAFDISRVKSDFYDRPFEPIEIKNIKLRQVLIKPPTR
jgi:cyclophilin family peptidyl-prolyl cis-trans isomerase